MGLIKDLGAGHVGIDTVAFIYFIEAHPKFLPVILFIRPFQLSRWQTAADDGTIGA